MIAAGVVAGWRAMKRPGIKLAVDGYFLRLPVIGGLLRGLDAARYARTLSTLTASGAPLLDGLQAANRTLLNAALAKAALDATNAVREGASLSNALRKTNAFPPMMVYMLAAGERSGALAEMLDKTATHLESDFENVVNAALKLLEPAIIILMGAAVTGIVLAILTPILNLNSLAAL